MTPFGLRAMRANAALVHTLPNLRLRLRHDTKMLLHVVSAREERDGVMTVTPCQFRNAVANMFDVDRNGRSVAFVGLEIGTDPAINLGANNHARVFPGGIVSTLCGPDILVGFATTAATEQCEEIFLAAEDDGRFVGLEREFRLHHDTLVGATVISIESPIHRVESSVRLLGSLLATCAANEAAELLPLLVATPSNERAAE